VLLLFVLTLTQVSCGDDRAAPAADNFGAQPPASASTPAVNDGSKGLTLTQWSTNARFQVVLQSDQAPLPVNRIHSWTVTITDAEGRHVDEAIVMVYGGMPEHKHGFPSKPEVTANLGRGRYRIEGVKFNMPGRWEMWINIRALGKDDKVRFSFDVP